MFVRTDLIRLNLIPQEGIVSKNVALGKNLVVTRASNKVYLSLETVLIWQGGVRIRIPLDFTAFDLPAEYNTKIDVICCHLAADSKGVSKLEKRSKNARYVTILSTISSELIDALVIGKGNGAPTGHVITMGDMNYRIEMEPEDVFLLSPCRVHRSLI